MVEAGTGRLARTTAGKRELYSSSQQTLTGVMREEAEMPTWEAVEA